MDICDEEAQHENWKKMATELVSGIPTWVLMLTITATNHEVETTQEGILKNAILYELRARRLWSDGPFEFEGMGLEELAEVRDHVAEARRSLQSFGLEIMQEIKQRRN